MLMSRRPVATREFGALYMAEFANPAGSRRRGEPTALGRARLARLGADGGELPFTPAALVRPGMVMFDEHGDYEMSHLCEEALNGDDTDNPAWGRCREVILDNRANAAGE